jgi:hypothetical protein
MTKFASRKTAAAVETATFTIKVPTEAPLANVLAVSAWNGRNLF